MTPDLPIILLTAIIMLLMGTRLREMERALRRSRPDEPHGRYAPWRYPRRSVIGWAVDGLANSRTLRLLGEQLPLISFRSDITNVIYINYLVDAERLEPFVPCGLELQRLGPGGRYALFTFLTYQHGHFGPGFLGRFRRLLPSPVQSNWRIYVEDPRSGRRGIYFITNAISSLPHAIAARWLSEGMPMHVFHHAEVCSTGGGCFHLTLDPGQGSAPDAEADLHPAVDPTLPAEWLECFGSYNGMLAYCVPQDRAFSSQPWRKRITRQEIKLHIPLASCKPLQGKVQSHAARAIAGDARAIAFRVPQVSFQFHGEEYDPMSLT